MDDEIPAQKHKIVKEDVFCKNKILCCYKRVHKYDY